MSSRLGGAAGWRACRWSSGDAERRRRASASFAFTDEAINYDFIAEIDPLAPCAGAGAACAAGSYALHFDPAYGDEGPEIAAAGEGDEGPDLVVPHVATRPDPEQTGGSSRKPRATEGAESLADEAAPHETNYDVAPLPPRPLAPQIEPAPPADVAKPQRDLTPELERLRKRMKACSEYYSQRPETTSERSPWGVMHALIAYGPETELIAGSQRSERHRLDVVERQLQGPAIALPAQRPHRRPRGRPGTQGHAGQLLAMLAQWRISPATPMKIQGRDFTVADFIEYEKRTCEPRTELTFKSIALSYYLKSHDTWTDDRGRTWSIPRLIQEELRSRSSAPLAAARTA